MGQQTDCLGSGRQSASNNHSSSTTIPATLFRPHIQKKKMIIIIIMSVFLQRLSMRNMLNCAEQVQVQKYKTHAYKTLKTVGVQIIMLKHPTKHKKEYPQNPYTVLTYTKITPTIQTNDDRHTHRQTDTHTYKHTHTHTHTQAHTNTS